MDRDADTVERAGTRRVYRGRVAEGQGAVALHELPAVMIVLVPIVVSVLVCAALVLLRFVGLEEGVPVVEYLFAFAYAAVVVNEEFGRDRSSQRGQRERHRTLRTSQLLAKFCFLGLLRRRLT